MYCILGITFAYCVFVFNYMPKHCKIEQFKQIFNEGTLLVLAYQMMLFTDFVSAQNYGYIGNSVVCLLLSNLALNLLATAYSMR